MLNHNAYKDVTKCGGNSDSVCMQGKISGIFQLKRQVYFLSKDFFTSTVVSSCLCMTEHP